MQINGIYYYKKITLLIKMINLIVWLWWKIDYIYITKLLNLWVREFFVWFIPEYWTKIYWFDISPNRRYSQEFQINTFWEFIILTKFLKKYWSKVYFTLNEHNYSNENYIYIKKILSEVEVYVDWIIIWNYWLLEYLNWNYKNKWIKIHISWDNFVLNKYSFDFLVKNWADRIIFPRNIILDEINEITIHRNINYPNIELELFIGDSLLYNCWLCTFFHWNEEFNFCVDEKLNSRKINYSKNWNSAYFNIWFDKDINNRDCSLCFLNHFIDIWINSFKIPWRTWKSEFLINKIIEIRKYFTENTFKQNWNKIILKEYNNCWLKKCVYEV